MKAKAALCLTAAALVSSLAWAATDLGSSKSNFYRLTYPSDFVSPAQARALLAELDKQGRIDDVRLQQWLPANFKRFGIAGERIAKLVIVPPDKGRKEIGIVLLTDPKDEAAAVALTKGAPSAGAK